MMFLCMCYVIFIAQHHVELNFEERVGFEICFRSYSSRKLYISREIDDKHLANQVPTSIVT